MIKMPILLILATIILLLIIILFMFSDADLTLLYYHVFSSPKDFQGQVIWITGASSGIGEYLAYSLIKRNSKLALSGVNVERLEKVKKHCLDLSKCEEKDIILVPFSMENFEVHEKCVKKVLDHFGHIDILINNAGMLQTADFQDIEIEADIHIFNINVFGAVNLTREVLKHFLERNKGHIVVTSSGAGKIGVPFCSAYTGSKHALHGYFETLRTELIKKNIHVTLACPGPVFSRLTERHITTKVREKNNPLYPTDNRMKTERCSELMVTAIAHKIDECWISIQPGLTAYYLMQYMPSIFRRVLLRRIMTKKTVKQIKQGG